MTTTKAPRATKNKADNETMGYFKAIRGEKLNSRAANRVRRGEGTLGSNPKGAARVGRKRKPQSKAISRTPAGKFGARLEALADEANLTASELGKRIGKSEDTIWTYFKGRAVPHIDDWPRIAKALGLADAGELLPTLPAK